MEVYLAVPFKDKDKAKDLGARWDSMRKQWYAPNAEPELLENWRINPNPVTLDGEDTTYGGNTLFVDLIPTSCWFTNVRSCIHPADWDRLRRHVYRRAKYICECCGIDTQKMDISIEAHERWDYNEETHVQKLVRILALCRACHQSTHMGMARKTGKGDEAKEHLKKVRNFTESEANDHIKEAFDEYDKRSDVEWDLDLSLITSNNIRLSNNRRRLSSEIEYE